MKNPTVDETGRVDARVTRAEARVIGTIDLTPSWEGVLAIHLAVLDNRKAGLEARATARAELRRMAQLADRYVEVEKARRAMNPAND